MAEKLRVGIIGVVSSYSLHYGQSLSKMDGVDFVGLAHLGRAEFAVGIEISKTLEAYAERFGVDIYETANELIDRGKADALSFVPKIIYVMLYWRLNAESTHYYLSLLLSQ